LTAGGLRGYLPFIVERRTKFSLGYFLVVLAVFIITDYLFFGQSQVEEISYSEFRNRITSDSVESVVLTQDKIYGLMKATGEAGAGKAAGSKKASPEPPSKPTPWRVRLQEFESERAEELKRRFTVVPVQDEELVDLLQSHSVDYRRKLQSNTFINFLLNWILPFVVLFFLWGFLMRRMGKGLGALNVGKNRAQIYEVDPAKRVTFQDVAGVDEAVEELKEVVDFLQHPATYQRLGAKLPKGVLLVGPPGTGKTLLARAVAGEAAVPFFSLTGSDFVEMFVGVGAARVRDLFSEAKKKAPCIIFVDELDAVGRSRGGAVSMGSYDERENTLNQLLSEMDGFDPQAGIVIMAATNRPEILDPALLRPGRFDRQILVDRPDRSGREKIFGIHVRGLILAEDVDLDRLAGLTPGFAGADIANICNEAALLASRKGHDSIDMTDFQDAIERSIAGLEKNNKLINPKERRIVAYHESGHAIVGHFTPGADPVQKVSIVPRGVGALGYTLQSPLEDRYLMSRTELLGKIQGLLGGRAAEQLVFGEVSTGASDDLEKVARIARSMVTVYGMSKRSPNLSLVAQTQGFLGQGPQERSSSEKLEESIDEEMQEIIGACFASATDLLGQKRNELDRLAALLLDKEKIDEDDLQSVLGPRPVSSESGPSA
jgi:cell division protease FtsH